MATPVIKVILLLLGAVAYRAASKAPTPPPSKTDHVIKQTLFDKGPGPRVMVILSEVFCIGYLMAECTIIIILNIQTRNSTHPPHGPPPPILPSSLCPSPPPSLHTLSSPSPPFLLSISTIYTGALLRTWCFKTLGKLFTYEITIKPDHNLITSGPYAYVRHPSYTAMALMIAGATATCLSPGSYFNQCRLASVPGVRWIGLLWVGFLLASGVSVWQRAKVEDEYLGKVFEEGWDRYSRAVPYSFVLGVM